MSVQSEIDRINGNIANTYSVLSGAGATMPAAANSNNLAGTAASISAVLYGKQQSLTAAQKQQARVNIGAISEVDVPKKGVDYFTPADQEAIVQQVISALGTPVYGRVDADKHIILSTEHLADGTYTLMQENDDGTLTQLCVLEKGNEPTSGSIPVVWNPGYTIDGNTGVVSQSSFSWGATGVTHASDPIDLPSGRTYRLTTKNADYTLVYAYYYTAAGAYISRSTLWDTRSTGTAVQNITLSLPANAGLVRFRGTGATYADKTTVFDTKVKAVVEWEVV